MDKLKQIGIHRIIGYMLTAIYIVSLAALLFNAAALDMLPMNILVLTGIVLAVFAVLFALMHKRLYLSVLASLLTIAMIAICAFGNYYIRKTNRVITKVAATDAQTDMVGIYVMKEDRAKKLSDVADYEIGTVRDADVESIDKAIVFFEKEMGNKLDIVECSTKFTMMNDLRKGTVQAVVIKDAYIPIIGEVEGFEWVTEGIRRIAEAEFEVENKMQAETPESVPETFVVYLSGIDTYGGVSARSRSDVNILAVVNTKAKEILLLSTPRDAYVAYSRTGGQKDKLTHAGIYGVEESMNALEQLYDIDVDYYLRLNFTGFMDIIDALGGIEVYSERDFTVAPVKKYKKGWNKLNGVEALAFARERYSFKEGDYQRAKNQMEVIRALVQKCASPAMLTNYSAAMSGVSESFETNMPKAQIAGLIKMQLSDMAQWEVKSYTTGGTGKYAETFSMPGQKLYVIELRQDAVNEAKNLIRAVYAAK